MSADTMLLDSLNKRKQGYTSQLMILARKRYTAQRNIDEIDRETEKLEAALSEVQRAEGDWQAQVAAVAAEEAQEKEKGA